MFRCIKIQNLKILKLVSNLYLIKDFYTHLGIILLMNKLIFKWP